MITIIPAMDLIDGQCVRLTQGDFSRRTQYDADPLSVAKNFEDMGLRRLHMVDLDGARTGKISNLHVLERIARETSLEIDFSGGIQHETDLRRVFGAGAALAGIGSLAVTGKEQVLAWAAGYGPEKLLLGADVRDGRIQTRGWQQDTALDVCDFIDGYYKSHIRQIFCTDVGRDGMMSGPSLPLYRSLRERFPDLQLIASGGVHRISDISALSDTGCSGVIVGKAFYEGSITPEEIRTFITDHGTDQTYHTLPGHP